MKKMIAVLLILFAGISIGFGEEANVKVTDQLGREIILPHEADRVVSLWPEATRVVFALGAEDKIVGIDSSSKTCPILKTAFPEINETPDVGSSTSGTLSNEAIAKLNPDVIFMSTDNPDLSDRIQKSLGVPVVCVRFNPPPSRKYSFDLFSIIGKCVGKEARGEEVKSYLEQNMSEVISVTSKLPDSEKPKVYVTFAYDLLKTIGYFDVVDLAGGKNIDLAGGKKDAWVTVSLEDLNKWNPDVIILHGFGNFAPQDVLNDSNWQQITAVKNKRVYKLTLGWTGFDPAGFVVNVMLMAKVFHPDKFDINVENEANQIFEEVYGVEGLYGKLKGRYGLSDI